jgi:hypothetical protein
VRALPLPAWIPVCLLLSLVGGCGFSGDPPVNREPAIVRLEVTQVPFAGAPTFSTDDTLFTKVLLGFEAAGPRVSLGAHPGRHARPLALQVSWSLRSATRIRPVTDGDRMLDHAVELTVRSALLPLHPHAPEDVHSAVAGRWIQYAQADVKSFDARLAAELADAFAETLAQLWMEADLREMPPDQVLRLLADGTPHQRRAAVEAVKRRRLPEAVPALIHLLDNDESLPLRMTVAGVLAHLGDPAAVEPIAELTLLVAPEQAVYLCSELARIGGEDARRFLHWVAAAHRVPEVRRAAANLLRTMLKELPLHEAPPR